MLRMYTQCRPQFPLFSIASINTRQVFSTESEDKFVYIVEVMGAEQKQHTSGVELTKYEVHLLPCS